MSPLERVFVVDRRDGQHLWLVGDDDSMSTRVPSSAIPFPVSEGACLRVRTYVGGDPDWASARLDPALREQRLKEGREALERLRRRDPGGDVAL